MGLRRMLLHCFRLSCWLKEFLDVLLVKTKFSLLVLHLQNCPHSQLGSEELPDDFLGGHVLGHGAEESAEGGELLRLLLGHLGQLHRLFGKGRPRYERDKHKSEDEREEGHLDEACSLRLERWEGSEESEI